MNLPRPRLGSGLLWYALWKQQRRENARLRKELREWQNKFLEAKQSRPLFYEPPKSVEQPPPPPIGPSAKRAQIHAMRQNETVKSDEEILEAARKAVNGNGGVN